MISILKTNISPQTSFLKFAAALCLVLAASYISATPAFAQSEASDKDGVRPVTQVIDDSATTFRIRNFIARNENLWEFTNVNVTTVNGIVLLTGNVKSAEEKQWIEDLASGEQGVRKVVNELRVERIRSALQIGKDKLLQLSVKHRMTKGFKQGSASIHIVVYRKTIYLMGYVDSETAEKATEIARTTKGIERVIKVFELIEN